MNDFDTAVTQKLEERLHLIAIPPAPVEKVLTTAARQRRAARLLVASVGVVVVLAGVAGSWLWFGQVHQSDTHQAVTAAQIVQALPCEPTRVSHTETGVQEQTCLYEGHKMILWTLNEGSNQIYPASWVHSTLVGTPDRWIAGCARSEDCQAIQSRFGGHPSSGSSLGISIVVK
jgi:hypothetical protein